MWSTNRITQGIHRRSLVGATWPFRYTVFLGLLCTGLPATNKVLLKVWERECEHRKAKAA